ncbi:hypothetical protein AMEX_G24737 [Astyanax mexicanus]|uniref:Uncharacterized protein n=1 Tax=Astyanax mexicanus TaxID=7994 RepID=A0A8T2KVS5_ASTMX|nr:hypothetical protein AMEX_G24737 [Astyanax mexicanus]
MLNFMGTTFLVNFPVSLSFCWFVGHGLFSDLSGLGSSGIIIITVSICVVLLLIGGLTLTFYKQRYSRTGGSTYISQTSGTIKTKDYESNPPGMQENINMSPNPDSISNQSDSIYQNLDSIAIQSDSVYQSIDPNDIQSDSFYQTLDPNAFQSDSLYQTLDPNAIQSDLIY